MFVNNSKCVIIIVLYKTNQLIKKDNIMSTIAKLIVEENTARIVIALDALEARVNMGPVENLTKTINAILVGNILPAQQAEIVAQRDRIIAAANKTAVVAAPVIAQTPKGPSRARKIYNGVTYLPRKAYEHKCKVSAVTVSGAALAVKAAASYCQPTTSLFGSSAQSAVCNAVTTVAGNLTNETFVIGAAITTVGAIAYYGAQAIRAKKSAPAPVAPVVTAPVVTKGDARKVTFRLTEEKSSATAASVVEAQKPATPPAQNPATAAPVGGEQKPATQPAAVTKKPEAEKNSSLAQRIFARFFGKPKNK